MRGRRRRRRDAGGSRRVRVDAGGPAGSPRGAAQAARRAHDTHARDGRAGAIRSWLFVFSQVLPTRPYRALSRLCATSPPRTCSRRPRWTQPRANTPVGSASGRCSSRYCGGCTRRSWTRSLYLRQGEVYTLLCFSFVFVLDVVSMRCPLSSPCFVTYPTTPAKRRETGRCKEKQKHTTLHPATSSVTRPYPPEDIEAGADELVPSSPAPRTRRDALDAFAATNATNTWLKLSRPGDDGDTCYLGFADTTLLDFVSRGLDARELEDKRVGDFDPSHRIAVFTEPESESSSKTNGHGDSSDEDGRLVRSGHATSVGQRGFAAGRARPDGSGPGSTRYFSENRDDGVAGVNARGLLGGGGDVRLFRRRVFRVDAQLKGERGGGAGQTRSVHDRVDIGVGCETSDVRERPGGRVDVDRG